MLSSTTLAQVRGTERRRAADGFSSALWGYARTEYGEDAEYVLREIARAGREKPAGEPRGRPTRVPRLVARAAAAVAAAFARPRGSA